MSTSTKSQGEVKRWHVILFDAIAGLLTTSSALCKRPRSLVTPWSIRIPFHHTSLA